MKDEIAWLRAENFVLKRKLELLEGDREKFVSTDDCYYWTPEGQREKDELKSALTNLVNLMQEGNIIHWDEWRARNAEAKRVLGIK